MSSVNAHEAPAASSARHRERIAGLAVFGMIATLAFGAVTIDRVVDTSTETEPTSLAAPERVVAGPSRSQASEVEVDSLAAAPLRPPLALVGGGQMFPVSSSGVLVSWQLGAPVEAHDVAVESTAPNGFWIGSSREQRVFVSVPNSILEKGSLGSSELKPGELVNVSGRVGSVPDNIGSLGLDPDSRLQLNTQERLVEANSVRRPS